MSTVTDPIADFLARVRNGTHAQKSEVLVPYSKIKAELARILKDEGYISDYSVDTSAAHPRIKITDKVKVNVDEEGAVSVEGPKGKLQWKLPRQIRASVKDNQVSVMREAESRGVKALHGLSRSLVHNMVQGVSEGFTKQLEIEGVGFKAAVQGSTLNLTLGFSHPVPFSIPADIKITVADNTKITVQGVDKKLVGQVAADIRRFYPPEPYKGKGVRYAGEQIRRKEGKTVQ